MHLSISFGSRYRTMCCFLPKQNWCGFFHHEGGKHRGVLSICQKTTKPKQLRRERPAEVLKNITNFWMTGFWWDCTVFVLKLGDTHLLPTSTFTQGQEQALGSHMGSPAGASPGRAATCRSLPWGHLCSQHMHKGSGMSWASTAQGHHPQQPLHKTTNPGLSRTGKVISMH